jgi:deoxyribodipyrimidine photolyase-related protein
VLKVFLKKLNAVNPPKRSWKGRRWLYVAYDQLNDGLGELAVLPAQGVGIVLVESAGKAGRRPYHKQKLALLLTNVRHFALEQATRGVAVLYLHHEDGYLEALRQAVAQVGPLSMMEAAERELRHELTPLVASGEVVVTPHQGWLTTAEQFTEFCGSEPPWRMDSFYRGARRTLDVLMEKGKPLGGRFSFDGDNREPWKGDPLPPEPPVFAVNEITAEVCEMVRTTYASHPGTLTPNRLPATAIDAQSLWQWALQYALPMFGPFEDAMSTTSTTMFHTLISSLMNLQRLLPARIVADTLAADIALPSKEGFVRQILGWREFVHHVHVTTDGFRSIAATVDGNAHPAFLGAGVDLPAAFWGGVNSGMNCLDSVVKDVWDTGYSHHITRLMVLGNIATLLDVSPRQLTDWFWVAYTDAFDWVVEPNVLGMATYSVGDVMTTKPYVAGSAYIDRMSDYCKGCAFAPKTTCPLTAMYWAFLDRNLAALDGNQRMLMPLAAVRKRTEEQRSYARMVFEQTSRALASGRPMTVADLPPVAAPPGKANKKPGAAVARKKPK